VIKERGKTKRNSFGIGSIYERGSDAMQIKVELKLERNLFPAAGISHA
jgi:hypothetical protein